LARSSAAKAAKARFIPPRNRMEAEMVLNNGESRADLGTRIFAASSGLRLKYQNAAPNQRTSSTRTIVKADTAEFTRISRSQPRRGAQGVSG
jgi:hypothetical protein